MAVQENGDSVPNVAGDRLPYHIDAKADAIVVFIAVDSDASMLSDLALNLTKAIAERTGRQFNRIKKSPKNVPKK